jgi:hypothetical protein
LFLEGGGEKDVQDKSFNFKLYPKPYLLENLLMKRRSREINLNLTSICLEDQEEHNLKAYHGGRKFLESFGGEKRGRGRVVEERREGKNLCHS